MLFGVSQALCAAARSGGVANTNLTHELRFGALDFDANQELKFVDAQPTHVLRMTGLSFVSAHGCRRGDARGGL